MREVTVKIYTFKELDDVEKWNIICEYFWSNEPYTVIYHNKFIDLLYQYNSSDDPGIRFFVSESIKENLAYYIGEVEKYFEGIEYYRFIAMYHEYDEHGVNLYANEIFLDDPILGE